MTSEEKNGAKLIGILMLIALLWIVALTALFWIGGKLDDGPAARPSEWRK